MEKCEFLFWLACHDCLPANLMRNKRGLSSFSICSRFMENEESVLHYLQDCRKARHIWNLIGRNHDPRFLDPDLVAWLRWLANKEDSKLFCAMVLWIWWSHNAEVLGDQCMHPFSVARDINANVMTLSVGLETSMHHAVTFRLIKWIWPPTGFVKLNVDGSSRGNLGLVGFGSLLRGADGHWIVGFHGFIVVVGNLFPKLLAMCVSLRIDWEQGYTKVLWEPDSLEVIHLIKSQFAEFHHFQTVLMEIKH